MFCATHNTTVTARDLETAHLHICQEAKSLESAFCPWSVCVFRFERKTLKSEHPPNWILNYAFHASTLTTSINLSLILWIFLSLLNRLCLLKSVTMFTSSNFNDFDIFHIDLERPQGFWGCLRPRHQPWWRGYYWKWPNYTRRRHPSLGFLTRCTSPVHCPPGVTGCGISEGDSSWWDSITMTWDWWPSTGSQGVSLSSCWVPPLETGSTALRG